MKRLEKSNHEIKKLKENELDYKAQATKNREEI